jgi:hypothetical protein
MKKIVLTESELVRLIERVSEQIEQTTQLDRDEPIVSVKDQGDNFITIIFHKERIKAFLSKYGLSFDDIFVTDSTPKGISNTGDDLVYSTSITFDSNSYNGQESPKNLIKLENNVRNNVYKSITSKVIDANNLEIDVQVTNGLISVIINGYNFEADYK